MEIRMATHSGLPLRKLPRCLLINFQELSSLRRLCFFFILWACLSSAPGPAEALKVSMPTQKTAILGTNVTLPCQISDYPPPELDIKKTMFIWYLETSEGNNIEKLYTVAAGEHSSNRGGSRLDPTQLKNGNASLFLPQVQLNEEGTYICVVIDSSVKVEGTTTLDLIVEPTVQLFPKELEIERGNVKTLTCRVNKFYPDSIVILWQKHSQYMLDKSILVEDICTGTSVRNGDGTYNITSKLRLQPSSQDQGNIYSCIVKHKLFARYPVSNVTLTVTEPNSTTWLIIGLVLGFLLISFLIVGSFLYIHFLKKYPPSVEMVGSEELKDSEETQLLCLISHFRPKPLQIDLFLVTELQNTKQKLASWSSTSVDEATEDDENIPLLGNLENIFKVCQVLKSKPMNFYDFQWKICMNPDIQKLKKFELLLEVKHKGFQHGLCTKRKSLVIVRAPKIYKIECKPRVPDCGKPITLSCLLTEYYPPECDICWTKGFEKLTDDTIKTEPPHLGRVSKLYSRASEITFTPSAEDHEMDFFVEINHCNKISRNVYTVLLKDFPKLSNIVIEPSDADYGDCVTLTCDVTDFNSKEICTRWFLGDNSKLNGVITEDLDTICKGCYKLTSIFEFKATASVCDKAICFKVWHANLTKPITREVYLKLPGKRPVLSEIKATSDHQNILLEISISQFAPCDIQVRWYHGWKQISENINPQNIEIGEDHLCYFVSKVQLDPKKLRSVTTIRCEVKHSTSIEEKSLTLNEKEIQHYHDEPLPLRTLTSELSSHLTYL